MFFHPKNLNNLFFWEVKNAYEMHNTLKLFPQVKGKSQTDWRGLSVETRWVTSNFKNSELIKEKENLKTL